MVVHWYPICDQIPDLTNLLTSYLNPFISLLLYIGVAMHGQAYYKIRLPKRNIGYMARKVWPKVATISEVHCIYPIGHYIRPEYNRINIFCSRKSGHFIRMATINVATISGVHCIFTVRHCRIYYRAYSILCSVTRIYYWELIQAN